MRLVCTLWETVLYRLVLIDGLYVQLKQNLHGMPIRAPSTGLYSSYLLLGSMASSPPAEFPSKSEIFKLWSTFCDNVDPLTKILHIPSTNALLTQSLQSEESDFISQKLQGLIFAICACAAMSIGDNECEAMLGSSISLESLLAATAASLVESSFMQSLDLITLQTYVLFLVCIYTLLCYALIQAESARAKLHHHLDSLAARLRAFIFLDTGWYCYSNCSDHWYSPRWDQIFTFPLRNRDAASSLVVYRKPRYTRYRNGRIWKSHRPTIMDNDSAVERK